MFLNFFSFSLMSLPCFVRKYFFFIKACIIKCRLIDPIVISLTVIGSTLGERETLIDSQA